MSERTPMQPVPGLTKSQRPSVASVPPPPPRPVARDSAPSPAATKPPAPAPAQSNVRPMSPKTPPALKSAQSTGGTRDATFTTPVEVRERLRQLARASKHLTIPGIVLAALEDNVEDLERLVDLEKGTEAPSGRLFPDPTSTIRSSETRVPVSMRLTAANLAVVDGLVTKTRADNRSQLLTAALRPYLAGAI